MCPSSNVRPWMLQVLDMLLLSYQGCGAEVGVVFNSHPPASGHTWDGKVRRWVHAPCSVATREIKHGVLGLRVASQWGNGPAAVLLHPLGGHREEYNVVSGGVGRMHAMEPERETRAFATPSTHQRFVTLVGLLGVHRCKPNDATRPALSSKARGRSLEIPSQKPTSAKKGTE